VRMDSIILPPDNIINAAPRRDSGCIMPLPDLIDSKS
jgi:hypothetical protein